MGAHPFFVCVALSAHAAESPVSDRVSVLWSCEFFWICVQLASCDDCCAVRVVVWWFPAAQEVEVEVEEMCGSGPTTNPQAITI